MKALGAEPNLVIYNTLLDAMGRAKRPCNGLSPSWVTYAALLWAFSRARYDDDALNVYKEMKEKGMQLNVILFNTILAMCADVGYIEEVVEIFEDLKRSDTKPDSWTFSSMMTIYSYSGNVSEAEAMLNEMLEAGFEPNIFILTSLIQCYRKFKRIVDIVTVRTFNQLLELGISPDERLYGCLLNVMTQTPKEKLDKLMGCIDKANSKLGQVVKLLLEEDDGNDNFKKEASELFDKIGADLRFTSQWSLNLKGLSLVATLTALHVWINDLSKVLESGEEFPPLLGINTGHGKHKYSDKGLASVFESLLKELNAPFHEASNKAGWFFTSKVATKSWLESRSSSELVAA
ncbi:hypothetical protein UlMin_008171 [Ulmus minor]